MRPKATGALYRFDADIVNNSLAVSPNEGLAVASYSPEPNVRVYDIKSRRHLTTIPGFITPRNILITPDGTQLLISDSTRGDVVIIDANTFKIVGSIPIGAGAFGTIIDSKWLFSSLECRHKKRAIWPLYLLE